MDVPVKHPNCLGSILSLISVIIHPTTKSSRTLARQGVSEMGLVSPSQVGGCDFGTGMMSESFHIAGTIPDESDVLKIVATGSANS